MADRLVLPGTHRVKTVKQPDRFSEADVARIFEREQGLCILAQLIPGHECRGRITIEHVKDSPRMGKRAPSDRYHGVLACLHGNSFTVETSKYRPLIRKHLAKVEPRV
jgi:hypothetical protein